MSREQWGHGFYKGYEAGAKGQKEEKYICMLDEKGHLINAYMIIEKHGDTYTLEDLSDLIVEFVLLGCFRKFSEVECDIVEENVIEKSLQELNKFHEPICFYSQAAFIGWVIRDYEAFIMEGEYADEHK